MLTMAHYIDEFSDKLPEFSKAICLKLDEIIHLAQPKLEEGKKWEMIGYSTHKGLVCGMYAAKEFVTFTFYNGALMKDTQKLFNYGDNNAKNRSIKFNNLSEVEKKKDGIISYIKEATRNSLKGLKTTAADRTIETPKDFTLALMNASLLEQFEDQSYTMKKEYIVWITEAKKEETRNRRIEKALIMLKEKN
jgi:uncharacterized protein YdeI (YjbR/CyaY-like superfamily)